MLLPAIALVVGICFLLWGADRFVEGSASLARHFKIPSLLIGMVIVGFGTSAPELLVSGLAASDGNPGLALGNAYGSNITNIALILGLTALISPIQVHSKVVRVELPILASVTLLSGWQIFDGTLTRLDGVILLFAFATIFGWTIRQGIRRKSDALGEEVTQELTDHGMPFAAAVVWSVVGLVVLVASSKSVVWGAVQLASQLGVSDMMIGLTVVAIGTSLPELAASLIATRRGEHDIALGNVVGSNLFNTLAVVGLASVIGEFPCGPETLRRDFPVMLGLTLSLFVAAFGFKGAGRINRMEGAALLSAYIAYTAYLVYTAAA